MSFLILSILLLVYLPAWALNYAYHDDLLYFLKDNTFSPFVVSHEVMSHGRFLAALLISIVGWFVHQIADLKFLRLLNIFTLSILGSFFLRPLSKYFSNKFNAVLLILILLTLPCFSVIAISASNILIPIAMIFAFIAAQWSKEKILWSVGLLLCSLCIYQPAAMVFWSGILLQMIRAKGENKPLKLFEIGFMAVVGLGTAIVYEGILWATKGFFNDDQRHGIYNPLVWTTHPWQRFMYFVREPLANVFNSWHLGSCSWPWIGLALWVILAVFVMQDMFPSSRNYQKLLMGLASITLLVLSFLPNFLARGDSAFYRCLPALTTTVFLVVATGLYRACCLWGGRWAQDAWRVILVVVLCYGLFHASENVMTQRVLPSIKECTYTGGILNALSNPRYDYVKIIRRDRSVLKDVLYDEWGTFSLDYLPDGFLFLVSRVQLFPYLSSQLKGKDPDFFVLQAEMHSRPDGRRGLKEIGPRYLIKYFIPQINTPDMHYISFRGNVYLLSLNGPQVFDQRTIVVNVNDI